MALTFCHLPVSASRRKMPCSLALTLDLTQATIRCFAFQRFFNAQQLVVLGNPVRTAQRTSLYLARAGSHRQVSNSGIFSFTGTVGNHRRVAGVLSHFDGIQSFRQATDLVELDQDGVTNTLLDTLLQDLGVGYEQVITHQLHLAAQLVGQDLPAVPVALVHAVFDGHNRVTLTQACQVIGEAFGIKALAFTRQLILTVFVEFRRGTIQRQGHIFAQLIASVFNSLLDRSQGRFVGRQVRRKTTLVAHRCVQALRLQHFLQAVEDFRADTQSLCKALHSNRLNHELLDVHVVIRVLTTVQDVHHRYRHGEFAGRAVDISNVRIQRLLQRNSSRLGRCKGDGQNGVGAQVGLVLGAVQIQHNLVQTTLIRRIFTDQCITNLAVYRINRFQDALTQITGSITITQLQRLAGTGGCTRRRTSGADGAVFQNNIGFNGRVAAGIQNLTGFDVGNLGHSDRSPDLLYLNGSNCKFSLEQVGDGFPKLCGALDGEAQASHGCAEGACFGKPSPTCSYSRTGQKTNTANQAVSIGLKLFTRSSTAFTRCRNGSSWFRRKAHGPSHMALSGSGWASRNKPARP